MQHQFVGHPLADESLFDLSNAWPVGSRPVWHLTYQVYNPWIRIKLIENMSNLLFRQLRIRLMEKWTNQDFNFSNTELNENLRIRPIENSTNMYLSVIRRVPSNPFLCFHANKTIPIFFFAAA